MEVSLIVLVGIVNVLIVIVAWKPSLLATIVVSITTIGPWSIHGRTSIISFSVSEGSLAIHWIIASPAFIATPALIASPALVASPAFIASPALIASPASASSRCVFSLRMAVLDKRSVSVSCVPSSCICSEFVTDLPTLLASPELPLWLKAIIPIDSDDHTIED